MLGRTIWVTGMAVVWMSFTSLVFAENKSTTVQRSQTFVTHLVQKKYTEAFAMMSPQMRAALDERRLEGMMLSLQLQLGKFEQIEGIQTQSMKQYQIALVTCVFQHRSLLWRLVFDAKGLVAGLQFLPAKQTPKSKSATSKPIKVPPYVNLALFTESGVMVGKQWKLQGTLSMPKVAGLKPAVILVHGSGSHDQDETIGPNKVFRDIAWGLASRGIAVLRYTKRNRAYGEQLKKDKKLAESMANVESEVIEDVGEAVALLAKTPGIDTHRIFVLGHSLGGMLAPAIALHSPQVAGLISMAGAVRPLEELVLEQHIYLMSADGAWTTEKTQALKQLMMQMVNLRVSLATNKPKGTLPLMAPWSYWLSLQRNDPQKLAPKIKQPMLILQGGRDYQVTSEDFNLWKKMLQGRNNVQFRLYPTLNHLFLAGKGKSLPAEYLHEGFVDSTTIGDIAFWVLQQKPWKP